MDVKIKQISAGEQEQVLICCREVTEEVREIAAFIRSRQGTLSGVQGEKQYEIPVSELYYIESVDGRTFLYTKAQVYETSYRIYELESLIEGHALFARFQIHAAEPDEDPVHPARSERTACRRSAVGRGSDHFPQLCQGPEVRFERRGIR